MSIFRRGSKKDQSEQTEQTEPVTGAAERVTEAGEATEAESAPESTSAAGSTGLATADAAEATGGGAPGPGRPQGPFDAAEIAEDQAAARLDLGALRILGTPGMELRLEIAEATQEVVAATAVLGESAVQLQAFAAPKTMGVWDDIRSEIAESIVSQGGTADQAAGPLGAELRARMPSAGPDGRTVFAPARFVGVDGPRWFLRAVFSGRAAIDDEAAGPLMDVVRGTVVYRGDTAMAPRELLALHLPQEVAEGQQGGDDDSGEQDADHQHGRSTDDLKPFERGPEITEVR